MENSRNSLSTVGSRKTSVDLVSSGFRLSIGGASNHSLDVNDFYPSAIAANFAVETDPMLPPAYIPEFQDWCQDLWANDLVVSPSDECTQYNPSPPSRRTSTSYVTMLQDPAVACAGNMIRRSSLFGQFSFYNAPSMAGFSMSSMPNVCAPSMASVPGYLCGAPQNGHALFAMNPEPELSFPDSLQEVSYVDGTTGLQVVAGKRRRSLFPVAQMPSNALLCPTSTGDGSTPHATPMKLLVPATKVTQAGTMFGMDFAPQHAPTLISAPRVDRSASSSSSATTMSRDGPSSASSTTSSSSDGSRSGTTNGSFFGSLGGNSSNPALIAQNTASVTSCTKTGRILPTREASEIRFDFTEPTLDWSIPAIPGLTGWSVQTKTGRTSFHSWTSAMAENQPEDTEWYKTSVYTVQVRMDFNPSEVPMPTASNLANPSTIYNYEMELTLAQHNDTNYIMQEGLRFTRGGPYHLKRKGQSTWVGRTCTFQPSRFSFVHNGKHIPFRLRLSVRGLNAQGQRVAEWISVSPPMFVKSKKPKHVLSMHETASGKRDRETAALDATSSGDEDDELPPPKTIARPAQ
eukprot:ANDGO_02162.mRNA.1 hypothetical protein